MSNPNQDHNQQKRQRNWRWPAPLWELKKFLRWVLFQKNGRLFGLAVIYGACQGPIPWVAGWSSYPMALYMLLVIIPVFPMIVLIRDRKNPQWVDNLLGATWIAIILELVVNNVSTSADMNFLSTQGVQGIGLIAMAVALGIAQHYAGKVRTN